MIMTKLEIYFFRQKSGKEPVRDWLRGLPPQERKLIGEDLKLAKRRMAKLRGDK